MLAVNPKWYKITNIFIETGTGQGLGIEKALKYDFKEIYSIELDRRLYDKNFRRFRALENVKIYHGDSAELFPEIMNTFKEPVTIWLDAHIDHFIGRDDYREYLCPLYYELEYLKSHPIKDHLIMIDDRRLFREHEKREGNTWGKTISEKKIRAYIKDINPDYIIKTVDGIVKNDIIIAY